MATRKDNTMTNSVDDGFVLIDDEYDNEVENLERIVARAASTPSFAT